MTEDSRLLRNRIIGGVALIAGSVAFPPAGVMVGSICFAFALLSGLAGGDFVAGLFLTAILCFVGAGAGSGL